MPDSSLYAGVELGGTKCICVLATGLREILAQEQVATQDPSGTLLAVKEIVSRWRSDFPIEALGVASFGPLDRDPASVDYGRLLDTPKPGWSRTDLLAPLRKLELPIRLDTDVNGAALAEARWGAARGMDNFVYVTAGTGIGVGTIVGGRAIGRGAHSEAGHMRVARLPGDRWPGACPYHGDCVEGIASGAALAARTGQPAETIPADDPAWDAAVHALAGLFHNLVLTVMPETILLGGGIGLGSPRLIGRIRSELNASLAGYSVAGQIAGRMDQFLVPPGLGALAGPLGAIALAMTADEAPP